MPGGGLGGAADLESVSALLSTPQGQAMVQAVLQNPEALLQRFPELRNNPEFAAAMQQIASNPQAFQQLMQEQAQRASNPVPIPRNIFDVAMDVMNGAELPDEYANALLWFRPSPPSLSGDTRTYSRSTGPAGRDGQSCTRALTYPPLLVFLSSGSRSTFPGPVVALARALQPHRAGPGRSS